MFINKLFSIFPEYAKIFIMQYRENPMFGRRVFFLNPPMSVENYVIGWLKEKDYEVYEILDYTLAKSVLRRFENSICFIFIDDVLPLDGWYNFIKSFEYDESLKTIFLGILSVKTKPKDQERFLMSLKLPGGFVMMDKKTEELCEQIEGILKINGARGVRKCIRLDLKNNNDVNGYFAKGTQLYSFKLSDISALGFATVTPARMANVFQKGSVISNISITIGRYSFTCSVVVFNAKIVGDQCIAVMLLSNDTSQEIRKKIHNFVYDSLEREHKILLENAMHDITDYTQRQRIPGEPDEPEEELTEIVSESDTEKVITDTKTDTTTINENNNQTDSENNSSVKVEQSTDSNSDNSNTETSENSSSETENK